MKQAKNVVNGALAGILVMGLGVASGPAQAGGQAMEKCAGIVKAGRNDCATSVTSCHGSVTVDAHPESWIQLPEGSCEKIVGGRVTAQQAPDQQGATDRTTRKRSGLRPPYQRRG